MNSKGLLGKSIACRQEIKQKNKNMVILHVAYIKKQRKSMSLLIVELACKQIDNALSKEILQSPWIYSLINKSTYVCQSVTIETKQVQSKLRTSCIALDQSESNDYVEGTMRVNYVLFFCAVQQALCRMSNAQSSPPSLVTRIILNPLPPSCSFHVGILLLFAAL